MFKPVSRWNQINPNNNIHTQPSGRKQNLYTWVEIIRLSIYVLSIHIYPEWVPHWVYNGRHGLLKFLPNGYQRLLLCPMSHGIGWWHRYPWVYHVITKQQCRYYVGSMILSCLMLFIHIKLRLWMWGDKYNPEVEMSSCHCRAVVENVYAFYWKYTWWHHQRETFFALLVFCAGNSRITGEFSAQRPVTRSFDVFFNLRPNKWLSKQWRRWCFETPFRSLRRHCKEYTCVAAQWI